MTMITMETAQQYAQDWVDAWNAHDLDAIMDHYAETIDFYSPLIIRRFGLPGGHISDRAQLRSYFEGGLATSTSLHFTLLKVFVGVDSITMHYGRHDGTEAAEMMVLDSEGRAVQVRVHYNPQR